MPINKDYLFDPSINVSNSDFYNMLNSQIPNYMDRDVNILRKSGSNSQNSEDSASKLNKRKIDCL